MRNHTFSDDRTGKCLRTVDFPAKSASQLGRNKVYGLDSGIASHDNADYTHDNAHYTHDNEDYI